MAKNEAKRQGFGVTDNYSPTRVRVILSDASTEEAFAAVTARRAIMLSSGSITADSAHVAVASAVGHADQLQVFHIVHHRWRRCVILCVCKQRGKF
jgi:hypothetical protein